MQKLFIEQTKGSPRIDFDPESNTLVMQGQSYPENAFKFYEPVFKWVDDYLAGCKASILIEVNQIGRAHV